MAIRPITGVSTDESKWNCSGSSIRDLEASETWADFSSRCSDEASSLTSALPAVSDIRLRLFHSSKRNLEILGFQRVAGDVRVA